MISVSRAVRRSRLYCPVAKHVIVWLMWCGRIVGAFRARKHDDDQTLHAREARQRLTPRFNCWYRRRDVVGRGKILEKQKPPTQAERREVANWLGGREANTECAKSIHPS
jgi:hypothetical protein